MVNLPLFNYEVLVLFKMKLIKLNYLLLNLDFFYISEANIKKCIK